MLERPVQVVAVQWMLKRPVQVVAVQWMAKRLVLKHAKL